MRLAAAAGTRFGMTSCTLVAQHLAGEKRNDQWADGHGDRRGDDTEVKSMQEIEKKKSDEIS